MYDSIYNLQSINEFSMHVCAETREYEYITTSLLSTQIKDDPGQDVTVQNDITDASENNSYIVQDVNQTQTITVPLSIASQLINKTWRQSVEHGSTG